MYIMYVYSMSGISNSKCYIMTVVTMPCFITVIPTAWLDPTVYFHYSSEHDWCSEVINWSNKADPNIGEKVSYSMI